jgi:hypothetical protein
MHQSAEAIARPLQGHHQTEKDNQPAGIKIAFAYEILNEMCNKAVCGAQVSSTILSFNLRPT